ncbi:hypothetical protein EDD21DRAFT_228463 [Dissophora ornata]|nr:hypothetical protein EDD21DRAFT_228463 [Dissophora ornata]
MESTIAERTPDLIRDNICGSSQGSRTITTTGAAIPGRNIDTSANMQLNSPPDSSPSHSPSPSIDTVIETPSTFSPIASALLAPIPVAKSRASMVFDSKVQLHPKGSLTPRPLSSRSSYSEPIIADDEYRQQTRSEPPPSFFNVSEVLVKRRAARSPLRPRAQTQGQGRERPYSMMVFPTHSLQAQQSFCLKDALPSGSLELQSSNEDHFPELPRTPDPFWDGSEDPEEPESNKRPKSELRGPAGRRARGTSLTNRPRPPLRRRSTMSMIADLDLSGADNAAQERGEDDEGGFFSIDVSGTLVCDEGENTAVQTPIKKKGTQRTPLTDISCSSVVQVSLGAKPLGPLMTRQPRKGEFSHRR